ncbi:CorA family divalent cation transporter [Tropicimonas sp. IMCC34043]|uniref:CorA family divalent cation transporter n=1 Tax=Tropicimonas sp. IMCC34043 TaxID=2248760 RepID=UPI001300B563|nr:CorA family divalent cation transporter [Tropicimonas sp. IMCC34043]
MAPQDDALDEAIWIDLYGPQPAQIARVKALGIDVPTLEDMEEIQLSSRLYREGDVDYITVVLPGMTPEGRKMSRPICFVLAPERLVTVRYHEPEPFRRFVANGGRAGVGCDTPGRVAMGLVEDIVDHLADALEEIGRRLDEISGEVFGGGRLNRINVLQRSLESAGLQGERIGKVRLSLLTMERALNYIDQFPAEKETGKDVKRLARGQARDVLSLVVHGDHLSARVSFVTDATLGLIGLEQNKAVSMLSAMVALFAPATLISSIWGMNFVWMPEIQNEFGFFLSLALMAASAGLTFLYFKWRGWL